MNIKYKKIDERIYEVPYTTFKIGSYGTSSCLEHYLPVSCKTREQKIEHILKKILTKPNEIMFITAGSLEGKYDRVDTYFGYTPVIYERVFTLDENDTEWLKLNSTKWVDPNGCECGADAVYGKGFKYHSFWCRRHGK